MGILDIEIVKGFMRMCNDGWLQGWHERNGGNLTYRMKEEEVAQCRPFFGIKLFCTKQINSTGGNSDNHKACVASGRG